MLILKDKVTAWLKLRLPTVLARATKRLMVHPRYMIRARACHKGYLQFGNHYAQNVLFIAGLPKSGTTWLKKMVASYPGFHELLIPDVASYELANGGSHDYELPADIFSRFENMLVVTKMHVHGSLHNVQLLRNAGTKYVIIYRDLRDVAVSHFFYVRQTPWHPEYPIYQPLTVQEGLLTFADTLLVPFADWVRSWQANRDPQLSLMFRYRDLLADTLEIMTRIAEHYGLDSSRETVECIVEKHSFKRLSGGRSRGEDGNNSFFRKGISGDWNNHFTPEIREVYKEQIGDFLIEYGFEEDDSW